MLGVKQYFGIGAQRFEGASPFKLIAAGNTNATLIRTTQCLVTVVFAVNVNAAARYLKFYDLARSPTVGTDVVAWTMPIPANSTTGGGFSLPLAVPMHFRSGLAIAMTTAAADSDTGALTAGDVVLTLGIVG